MLEYWGGPTHSYSFPKNVTFEHKIDTDLYEFVRHKTTPTRLTFSPDGRLFVVMGRDRKVNRLEVTFSLPLSFCLCLRLTCTCCVYFKLRWGALCCTVCRCVCSPSWLAGCTVCLMSLCGSSLSYSRCGSSVHPWLPSLPPCFLPCLLPSLLSLPLLPPSLPFLLPSSPYLPLFLPFSLPSSRSLYCSPPPLLSLLSSLSLTSRTRHSFPTWSLAGGWLWRESWRKHQPSLSPMHVSLAHSHSSLFTLSVVSYESQSHGVPRTHTHTHTHTHPSVFDESGNFLLYATMMGVKGTHMYHTRVTVNYLP